MRVGVLAGELRRRLGRQALDALVGLEVVLDEELLAGGVDPLEGVRAEASMCRKLAECRGRRRAR